MMTQSMFAKGNISSNSLYNCLSLSLSLSLSPLLSIGGLVSQPMRAGPAP